MKQCISACLRNIVTIWSMTRIILFISTMNIFRDQRRGTRKMRSKSTVWRLKLIILTFLLLDKGTGYFVSYFRTFYAVLLCLSDCQYWNHWVVFQIEASSKCFCRLLRIRLMIRSSSGQMLSWRIVSYRRLIARQQRCSTQRIVEPGRFCHARSTVILLEVSTVGIPLKTRQ